MIEILTEIFNDCLRGEEVPKEWKLANISPIFKKGNRKDCNNYRGISVTSSLGRLYGRILKMRIEEELEESEEQSGFRPGRSCIDNIFCLKQLAEKTIAHGRELHIVFIDLRKAYDSVPVEKLWDALKDKGVQTGYINAIKQLYKEIKSRVKVGGSLSEEFIVNKGLRQGCCISPTLFKIYIDKAIKEWKKKCKVLGVKMEDESLYSLLFADDQIIVAEDEDDVNYMFRKLVEELEKWGLEINIEKTQYMVIGAQGRDLQTDKGIVKHTKEYKYLGTTFTDRGRDDQDIQNKIKRGKTIVRQLHPVLWNNNITSYTKRRMFSTFIESTVTYGAEAWTLNKGLKSKINATEMMYWRRCCKTTILDRVRNDEIRNKMGVDTTLTDSIEKKQLMWYGHMRRLGQERLPQKIWRWKPENRRKRGRPRRTWNQEIKEAMEKRQLEEEMYLDREAWRQGCGRRPRRL